MNFKRSLSLFKSIALLTCVVGTSSAQAARYGFETKDEETRAMVMATVANNKDQAEWLLAKETIGLEILTGASTTQRVESLFGHTLIRLIDKDQDPMNDTIIGFEMLMMSQDLKEVYNKAFDGKGAVIMSVKTMADILVEYNVTDQRNLKRTVVPVTNEGLAHLKKTASDLIEAPSLAGTYGFFTNNCASLALSLLAEAGIRLDRVGPDVPVSIAARVTATGYTFYPSLMIPTAEAFFKSHPVFSKMKIDKEFDAKTASDFWKAISVLQPEEIEFLFHMWPHSWSTTKGTIAELFMERVKKPRSLNQVLGLKALPLAIYKSCESQDQQCRQERAQAITSLWNKDKIIQNVRTRISQNKAERQRALQLTSVRQKEILAVTDSPLVADQLQLAKDLEAVR